MVEWEWVDWTAGLVKEYVNAMTTHVGEAPELLLEAVTTKQFAGYESINGNPDGNATRKGPEKAVIEAELSV